MCGDYDDFYDDEEWPEGAELCDRCGGMGIANCYCGGDLCICENYGEMECPLCDGEGHWVPTEAYKKSRAEYAEMMRRIWAEDAAQGIEASGGDGTAPSRSDESPVRKDAP